MRSMFIGGAVAANLLFVAACGSQSTNALSISPTPTDYLVIVRLVSTDTHASVPGLHVTVNDGPRAGYSVSTTSDQAALQLPLGPVSLHVVATGHQPVDQAVTITGAAVVEVKSDPIPNPVPTAEPTPTPVPPESPSPAATFTLSGRVTDARTGQAISGVEVESVRGVNVGRGAKTDSNGSYRIDSLVQGSMTVQATAEGLIPQTREVVLAGNQSLDFTLLLAAPPPPPVYTFSGWVRDGRHTPIPGAVVQPLDTASPRNVTTGPDGTWSFTAAVAELRLLATPPSGYEAAYPSYAVPVKVPRDGNTTPRTEIMTRKIASVVAEIGYPGNMTIALGQRLSAYPEVHFDDAVRPNPMLGQSDGTAIVSSNPAVVRWNHRMGTAIPDGGFDGGYSELQALSIGSATITMTYYGVAAPPVTIQVVP